MTPVRRLRTLVIHAQAAVHIGTVADHLRAFRVFGAHDYSFVDSVVLGEFDCDLGWYDCLVFHYSAVLSSENHLSAKASARIAAFRGLKVAFIQDEYRWIDRQNAALEAMAFDVIFTVTNEDVTRRIYRGAWFDQVRFEHTLTGFVPEHLRGVEVPAYGERTIDVSYRARTAAPWYGKFADEKWQIGERFAADAPRYGLKTDIDLTEHGRIYGQAWIDFVANSRATLGTESGVSFIDFSGKVQEDVDAYMAEHPDADRLMVQERFLEGRDGDIVIHVISPRIFEAATLRSLMILYPGTYSGALEPWLHYVPLAKDHSNMDEVVAVLRDEARASEIIERAYRDIAMSDRWTFASMVRHFERVAGEEQARRDRPMSDDSAPLSPIESKINATYAALAHRNQYLEEHVMPVYEKTQVTVLAANESLVAANQGLVAANQELARNYAEISQEIEARFSDRIQRTEEMAQAIESDKMMVQAALDETNARLTLAAAELQKKYAEIIELSNMPLHRHAKRKAGALVGKWLNRN